MNRVALIGAGGACLVAGAILTFTGHLAAGEPLLLIAALIAGYARGVDSRQRVAGRPQPHGADAVGLLHAAAYEVAAVLGDLDAGRPAVARLEDLIESGPLSAGNLARVDLTVQEG